MAKKLLGETIDIHAGGMDLAFPHHENEIAQSEALTGKPFAKYWMHSAYLNVNNQKMSKSLNNFLTARDALKAYDGDVIRFLMLSAHYRVQLNFSTELLDSAKASVERLYNAIDNLENLSGSSASLAMVCVVAQVAKSSELTENLDKVMEDVDKVINGGMTTDQALADLEIKAEDRDALEAAFNAAVKLKELDAEIFPGMTIGSLFS